MVIKIAAGMISSYVILRRLTPKVQYTINSYPVWTKKEYPGDGVLSAKTTDFLLFTRTVFWFDSKECVYKVVRYNLRRLAPIKINKIKDEQSQIA